MALKKNKKTETKQKSRKNGFLKYILFIMGFSQISSNILFSTSFQRLIFRLYIAPPKKEEDSPETNIDHLMGGQLSAYRAQELIGSDLLREELTK